MVAPVIVAAGIAARYGAKKLMKHLTKQAIKKSKGKAAINKAQKTKKNIETRNNMDVDKASWKKVYRGAREIDGSYTDPANAILRTKGKVNIGSRPIGKNPTKRINRKYGDPELNVKGNQVMSKAYKAHSKYSPDNHDFPSGMIKETLPKKFFKKPMKTKPSK